MARIRSVKPEFFHSIPIAGLTRDARLLFIGLWTHVDDEGRCDDDPRLIKSAVFPLDDDLPARKVEALVAELATKGRITRYTVADRAYLVVRGWQHQKIDRCTPSKLPPPPDTTCESSTNDRRALDESSTRARPLIYGSMDQGSMDPSVEHAPSAKPTYPAGFDRFWSRYPRKASKADARKAYMKALKNGVTLERMLEALDAQGLERGDPKFVPYPASWLNGERWNDTPEHIAAVTPIRNSSDLSDDIVIGPDGVAMSRRTLGRG